MSLWILYQKPTGPNPVGKSLPIVFAIHEYFKLERNIVTFQVTIMFELRFLATILNVVELFLLIEILLIGFLAAMLNLNVRLQNSGFRFQISEIRNPQLAFVLLNQKGIVTFQVTIMFGLGFEFFVSHFEFCWVIFILTD